MIASILAGVAGAAAAVDAEGDSAADGVRGVQIHVDIAPLDCVGVCVGGQLPGTGADVPVTILLVGALLVGIGIALLVTRLLIRRRRHGD
ncbi:MULTISPECIES: hypothetical protein [Microbacterium]|uniref:hypothetical protein n=1 Tax=Microbacterium TaxID=33882 RepID=UPI001CBB8932|nr:hypothetical protein [Microbacterium sp. OVT16B]